MARPLFMRCHAVLLSLCSTLVSSSAFAAGFYISDIGTRGMARGGAFVANPDSLLAIHYNPAGLSLLRGFQFEASLSLVQMDVDFSRTCPCVDPTLRSDAETLDAALESNFSTVNSATPLAIPFLAVGYGLPIMDLTFALGVWGPNSGRHYFGEVPGASSPRFQREAVKHPERYSALESWTLEANFALGVAAQPIDGLRVGFTAFVYQSGSEQMMHLWTNSGSLIQEPEDPRLDAPVFIEFHRPVALDWQVGASYELIPGLTIGSSFRGKRSIRSDGTIKAELPGLLRDDRGQPVEGAAIAGENMEIELNTAPIWRMGVQYELPQLFRAEAAFVLEGWSTHDRIVIRTKDISILIPGSDEPQTLGEIVVDRNWKNAWSLRLGGELNLFEPFLGVQAGYFFEPTAIPPAYMDPSRLDFDKHGIALGVSTSFFGAKLEISGMYVALVPLEVRDSKLQVTAPLDPPLGSDELTTWVANGDYKGYYFIGSASLSFALDPLLGML